MTKLDKATLAQRDDIVERLRDARTTLEQTVDAYNAAINEKWPDIQDAIEQYNVVMVDAKSYIDEVAQEITDFIENKSEKWQDSERGQMYKEWKAVYDDLEFEEVEMEQPDELQLDAEDHAEVLEQASEEPYLEDLPEPAPRKKKTDATKTIAAPNAETAPDEGETLRAVIDRLQQDEIEEEKPDSIGEGDD